ncbi:hypothetical protein SDRG_14255 [Saprolegnia diclina VS20]|uniref:Uncharacterized protein n=1 Tax=Saprolegnia diclina (strain VS20) TaxID=1156394 RepID=T0PR85_SAPDV|nr:hypothetical protein SDRG_14255 [Saprolegnia diclina VS20]EQC27979.1 hypothetical protein SDRG_14255 [Saprolegnia diclina VS20]|eukprot:XP_008618592.1 hypothetical protein SDRG_14255 [Saprolegnia diclina VS20]
MSRRHVLSMTLPRNGLPTAKALPHHKAQRPAKGNAAPSALGSALWGFPVYFSPEMDREHDERAQRVAALRAKLQAERSRQVAAHEAEVDERMARSRRDHTKYLYYASRYGALPALLFCCTQLPGRVYELYVHSTANALQTWARARMCILKAHARSRVASAFVASIVAAVLEKRSLAATQAGRATQLLRRIVLRAQVQTFGAWKGWLLQTRASKRKFQAAMNATLASRFATWRDHAHTRAMIRHGKLCQASVKVFRRSLINRFGHWHGVTQRTKGIRRRFTNVCVRRQRELFGVWTAYVAFANRTTPYARRLQVWFRRSLARARFRKRQHAATTVARHVRGHLARRHVVALRASMRALESKLRFERRKALAMQHEAFNASLLNAIATERDRRRLEEAALQQEQDRVEAEVKKALAKILGNEYRAQLREKMTLLKQRDGLDAKRASAKAATEVIADAVALARDQARSAFRATRPPPAVCTECQLGLPTMQCPHVCGEADDEGRYEAYAREQVLLQAVALAQLERETISFAALYQYKRTTIN